MDKQVEASPATLDTLFPNNDLLTRVQSFVDGVSHIDGVNQLILRRFNDGTARFYAIWESSNAHHAKVTSVWEESFDGYERVRADLLVIQYSRQEFEQREAGSYQLRVAEKSVLWEKLKA